MMLAVDEAWLGGELHDRAGIAEHEADDGRRGYTATAQVADRVGSVVVKGVITPDCEVAWRSWSMSTACTDVARAMRELDARYAAGEIDRVVLNIDSGGGYTAGVLDLCATIEAMRAPTAAYIRGAGCSAAYAIAAACDRIVGAPMARIGCIGAIILAVDDSQRLASLGVRRVAVRSQWTPRKGVGPDADGFVAQQQPLADEMTRVFLEYVGRRRRISGDTDALAEATGRADPLSATDALRRGLIDEIGTWEAAAGAPMPDGPLMSRPPARPAGTGGDAAAVDQTTGPSPMQPAVAGEEVGAMPDPKEPRTLADIGGGRLLEALGLGPAASIDEAAAFAAALRAEHGQYKAKVEAAERAQREAETDALLAEHGVGAAECAEYAMYRAALLGGGEGAQVARDALARRGRVDKVARVRDAAEAANKRGALPKGEIGQLVALAERQPEHAAGITAVLAALPKHMVATPSPPPGGGVRPVALGADDEKARRDAAEARITDRAKVIQVERGIDFIEARRIARGEAKAQEGDQ